MECSNVLLIIISFSILTLLLWIQCFYYQQKYKKLKNRNFPEAIVIE